MLPIIKNFKDVIEHRDIHRMTKELYDFVILYCGFIAHYNIEGFKSTYSDPRDFTDVFLRHFDRKHPYFNPVYACHKTPYKDTELTKAEIKNAFADIVATHTHSITQWARDQKRQERYAVYLALKKEFEGDNSDRTLPTREA